MQTNNNQFEMQLRITPEMVAPPNQVLCNACGGDLWLLNCVTKIAQVPSPDIGQPPIDFNLVQHVCLTCLQAGTLTLRTRQNTQLRKDAVAGN